MPLSTRVSGAWKNISTVSVRVNGAWKTCNQVYVKVNGAWKPCFESTRLEYTVNTQAMVSGSKKSAVPFQLYGTSGITLTVNWGDGKTSTLTASNYSAQDNSTASVHTYSTAGTYTITVTSSNWNNVHWFTNGRYNDENTNANAAAYWFTRSITSVNAPLPKMKGTRYYDTYSKKLYYDDNDFSSLFYCCEKLKTIPSDLFSNLTNSTAFASVFNCCNALTTIPTDLFSKNTNVTDFDWAFLDCASLGAFTINIPAKNVGAAEDFVTKKSGVKRIVKVPNGSTTKTTFNAVASYLGLTIQNI